ncbi:hypothetical protein EAE99_005409 [Botrytis elliptica]|nr:hypothetical protein EAE99_005409 [Botrytis elliptica]
MGFSGIADTATFMQSPLPEKFRRGLEKAQWPGRCETRLNHGIRWLLDGAHTIESIEVLGPWVIKNMAAQKRARRVLIFNQQTKDATALLHHLWQVMTGGESAVTVVRTVEEAIRCAAHGYGDSNCDEKDGDEAVVLITGSLHLVGSALEFLDTFA